MKTLNEQEHSSRKKNVILSKNNRYKNKNN